MPFNPHATLKLKELNYNTLHIENVPNILSTFDGDVFFELPLVDNLNNHSRQMQRMDRKYHGHSWCKVKMTNIKNDFNLHFHKTRCLCHLQCQNESCNYLILNGHPIGTAWINDIILGLIKDHFTLGSCPIAKFAMPCYIVLMHVQLACITSCISKKI